MATGQEGGDPSLELLRSQFADGNIDAARRALLNLSDAGRQELEARLGPAGLQRMLRASRSIRGPVSGRVVVLHGIMGGKLATIDASGDEDLVWLNYVRLVLGRIERFTLDQHAEPADPRWRVVTRGLLDEYMPLVFELGQHWRVLPVAFDWRLDIDKSAAILDQEIRRWANGEPVHIVAHSMGGLVSRRFTQLFPDTWDAMKDPLGLKRGGRLVMLGTPNRGSFAIPFVLTGQEKTVRKLERFDVRHDLRELLEIINTFPGSYQMLPSPELAFGDDRMRLFDSEAWGTFPVPQKYLDLGRRFQQEMDAVKDPQRLVYVAGFDQPTPYRIRVDAPGDFSYLETLDGDGRVPHELGLLPDVATFYVAEQHGDLPANAHVLAGIHGLLEKGDTSELSPTRPPKRALRVEPQWRKAAEIVPPEPPIPGGRGRSAAAVSGVEGAALEAEIVSIFAGSGTMAARATGGRARAREEAPTTKEVGPTVTLEVMWADITQVDGEVIAAGHYEGVEPQAGELSLDLAVSGIGRDQPYTPDDLVITTQTRRGILRGAVGDINFFPWWQMKRTVAVAGMGHPGTFGVQALRRTTRSLVQSVGSLRGAHTVNTLLIGSGNGNLSIEAAVTGMLDGLSDALELGLPGSSVRRIRIVEWELRKAQRIGAALQACRAQAPPAIRIKDGVTEGAGGAIGEEIAMSAILLATAWRVQGESAAARKAAREVLQGIAATDELRRSCNNVLRDLGREPCADVLAQAGALNLARAASGRNVAGGPPTRISFIRDTGGIRAAAISDTAVVTERAMPVEWSLVEDIVQRMTDPHDVETQEDLAGLMNRLFVPRDFGDKLGTGDRLILEVDRSTSRIQWEMMESFRHGALRVPLALDRPMSRQLRTSYSPAPPAQNLPGRVLRALVIGDPGDPEKGLDLEGARQEALRVTEFLRERHVEVDLLVGASNVRRTGELRDIAPATVLDVLRLLDRNSYDILHYAGHADFDPLDPEGRAGWLFGDRLFTARDLASVSRVPSLVVANACLSGLTSDVRAAAGATRGRDDLLLPGLVDEFFRRGVRDYVGTAWPISDEGAVLFSEALYRSLLSENEVAPPMNLGQALLRARQELRHRESTFGALWAAYQHYGDPATMLRYPAGDVAALPLPARAKSARKRQRGRSLGPPAGG